jgi:phage terminase large subunit-like protein
MKAARSSRAGSRIRPRWWCCSRPTTTTTGQDEAVWRKANPSLGLSPTLQYLRREAALAKGNPRKTATFKCYHLNQWVESLARWLPVTKWNACAPTSSPGNGMRASSRGAAVSAGST